MGIDNKKLTVCPQITLSSVTDNREPCIRWSEVPDADKYAVFRSEDLNGEFVRVAWAKSLVYIDKNAAENTTYWYRIVALKELENKKKSKKSSGVTAVVVSDAPAPENLTAVCKGNGIALSWSGAGAKSFRIYRRSEHFNQLLPLCTVKGNKFTDKSAVQGQIYHYSVQSMSKDGSGNFSDEATCVNLGTSEIIYTKARMMKKLDLKARIVAGADGYIFERSEDGKLFDEIGRTEGNTAVRYTDKAEKAFKVYHYRVKAYKNLQDKLFIGDPSESVKIKTK